MVRPVAGPKLRATPVRKSRAQSGVNPIGAMGGIPEGRSLAAVTPAAPIKLEPWRGTS